MHVKPRMRPGEHAVGRLDIHEFPAHEQTQHRPSKGLGECGDIVQRQRDEGAVRPEPAIGHQQMQVRVPVDQGAVGLDRGDDAPGRERGCRGSGQGRVWCSAWEQDGVGFWGR